MKEEGDLTTNGHELTRIGRGLNCRKKRKGAKEAGWKIVAKDGGLKMGEKKGKTRFE